MRTNHAYKAFDRVLTDAFCFYHANHLGTPIAMTNGAGTLAWRAEHTPFGGIYALTVGTITNNPRFPGQYYDGETGLAQNYLRNYSASTGRYFQPDLLSSLALQPDSPKAPGRRCHSVIQDEHEEGGSLLRASRQPCLYSYAENNPSVLYDPLGLDTWVGSGVGGSTLLGLGGGAFYSGSAINLKTGETCTFHLVCWMVGVGLGGGPGAAYFGVPHGPHCGSDLASTKHGVGAAILGVGIGARWPQSGSKRSGTYSLTFGLPFLPGGWMGYRACRMMPQTCTNTPCGCN